MPLPLSLLWSSRRTPEARRTEVDLLLVPKGFLALILMGTFLLALPWAHQPGQTVGVLNAAFIAVSATCVTGLASVNIAEAFSPFGQAVILALIQLGGLGIFTASILLVLLSGRKLSLVDEHIIHATLGRLRKVQPLDIFFYGCTFILIFELAGTLALFLLMESDQTDLNVWGRLWEAAFHSISAFCNAGLSIYPEGLARWRNQPEVLGVVCALTIAGGIGLMTLINLRYFYFWRRDPQRRGHLALQTRICVAMAAGLLLAGTASTLMFELGHTLREASWSERWTWAFFHSAMTRTAGFNVVDTGAMNQPTLLWTIMLMFVGGSPGSMAGGIKTTTFAVLCLAAWTALRRRENVQIFRRRIAPEYCNIALLLALLAGMVMIGGVGLLMLTEQGQPSAATPQHWFGIVFEAVSAFGTVGLSTGVTPLLTPLGKAVIMVLMFVGRVGPLVMALYLARPRHTARLRYPSEEIGLG